MFMTGYVDVLFKQAFEFKAETPRKRHKPMTSLNKKPDDPSAYFDQYRTRFGQHRGRGMESQVGHIISVSIC